MMRLLARTGRPVALAALCLASIVLAACGGGGSSATTSSGGAPGASSQAESTAAQRGGEAAGGSTRAPGPGATGSAGSAGASRPAPPLTRASAAAAERRAERREHVVRRRLARKAGKAAPFLVSHGDNSIPTYGSEASSGESASAEATLSRYLAARASGEWGPACAQMSARVQKQLALLGGEAGGEGSCPAAYAKLAAHSSAAERDNPLVHGLSALRVQSPHAFALFYGPGSQQYMMPLVQEEGAWKVTQIDPVPWPVGSSANGP